MEHVFEKLISRLVRQDLREMANHFSQAKSAFDSSEWESANSQVRSALESLFNSVTCLQFNTNKTGGKARQLLGRSGLLREREAGLVQKFMAVAGGAGSHVGVSNADESLGRLPAGIGIAYIGLALIPELVRVEDVIVDQLSAPPGARLPTDREIYTTCPTCGTRETLDEARITREGKETVYIYRSRSDGCWVVDGRMVVD